MNNGPVETSLMSAGFKIFWDRAISDMVVARDAKRAEAERLAATGDGGQALAAMTIAAALTIQIDKLSDLPKLAIDAERRKRGRSESEHVRLDTV